MAEKASDAEMKTNFSELIAKPISKFSKLKQRQYISVKTADGDAQENAKKETPLIYGVLFIILLLGLALRFYGINFVNLHWDEWIDFNLAASAPFHRLSLSHYYHGSFIMYVWLALWSVFLLLQGVLPTAASLLKEYMTNPVPLVLLARGFAALTGAATIAVVYFTAGRLYNKYIGLLAAFFTSTAFLHVSESRYARGHIPSTLLIALVLYYSARILERRRARDYLLAGVCLGLAAAAQYGAVIAALPLIAAHFLQTSSEKRGCKILLGSFIAAAFVFFLTTPYALLDSETFISQMRFFFGHEAARTYVDPEGMPIIIFYITEHLRRGLGTGLTVLGGFGIIYALYRRRPADWILAALPLFLLASFARGSSPNFARYALPLIPPLSILAARFLYSMCCLITPRRIKRFAPLIMALAAIAIMLPQLAANIRFSYLITQPDTRQEAEEWIVNHIPLGAKIAVEGGGVLGPKLPVMRETYEALRENARSKSYSANYLKHLIDTRAKESGYRLLEVHRLNQRRETGEVSDKDITNYADEGYEYLVSVSWMQWSEGDGYAEEFYRSLNELYAPVKEFKPRIETRWDPYAFRVDYDALEKVKIGDKSVSGGPRITVYRLRSALFPRKDTR